MSEVLSELEDLLPRLPKLSMEKGLLQRAAARMRDLEERTATLSGGREDTAALREEVEDLRHANAELHRALEAKSAMLERVIKGGGF